MCIINCLSAKFFRQLQIFNLTYIYTCVCDLKIKFLRIKWNIINLRDKEYISYIMLNISKELMK